MPRWGKMGRGRAGTYADRISGELQEAVAEDHTPRQVAGSFAVGAFITMLPTFGVGLILFVVIVYLSESVSKIALLASVVVFNPVVKWGVYVGSFALGVFLLGAIDGMSTTDASLSAGPDVVVRLLVGNLILAVVATVVSYVVVYRLAVRYEATAVGEHVSEALEAVVDDVLDPGSE